MKKSELKKEIKRLISDLKEHKKVMKGMHDKLLDAEKEVVAQDKIISGVIDDQINKAKQIDILTKHNAIIEQSLRSAESALNYKEMAEGNNAEFMAKIIPELVKSGWN